MKLDNHELITIAADRLERIGRELRGHAVAMSDPEIAKSAVSRLSTYVIAVRRACDIITGVLYEHRGPNTERLGPALTVETLMVHLAGQNPKDRVIIGTPDSARRDGGFDGPGWDRQWAPEVRFVSADDSEDGPVVVLHPHPVRPERTDDQS